MSSLICGTYRVPKDKAFEVVLSALQLGYRRIDCAELYRNEKQVASAINVFCEEKKIDRKEILVTSKIRFFSEETVKDRLKIFGELYCLLIHFPTEGYLETWNKLNEFVKTNNLPILNLGVSNFKEEHLLSLLSSEHIPYCNQIEASPFWNRNDIVKLCKQMGIKITAHSPLVKTEKKDHPVLVSLSTKYSCSWAQILLAYSFQKELFPIARSCNVEHLKDNLILPVLDWKDVSVLDGLDEQYATHPQYK